MYEIFEELCRRRGITAYKVCKDLGMNTATTSSWKAGRYTPKADKLQKIADYFGVTLEYLMGVQENEQRKGYYLNEKTAELAQEMYEDEDLRALFHMKRNMNPDKFKVHMETMKQLYRIEHPEDESIS